MSLYRYRIFIALLLTGLLVVSLMSDRLLAAAEPTDPLPESTAGEPIQTDPVTEEPTQPSETVIVTEPEPVTEPTEEPTAPPQLPPEDPFTEGMVPGPFVGETLPPVPGIPGGPTGPGGPGEGMPPGIPGGGGDFLEDIGLSDKIPEMEPVQEGQIKVACVGDSITYGYGILGWEENNYPVLLKKLLGDDYHVANFGVSGRCVQTCADYPYSELKTYVRSMEYDADILVFMMGSNDSKPWNWYSRETFRESLCRLLDSYGDVQILLCTPSACFQDDSGMVPEDLDMQPEIITVIAEIIRQVAQERGYTLVDIYALTEANPQWFAIDGIHPNNQGAEAIAEAVYEAINSLE